MDYKERYEMWLKSDDFDEATRQELEKIKANEQEIEDRFYKDLEFGTAGLRGKIGAGTNRMNRHIIGRATQGLAEVIKDRGQEAMDRGVAIAYDVRHFSAEFAKTAALVLAYNGVRAYLFEGIRPTPELSYAVRKLGTQAGIVVTASHNPKDYNGYKVYWEEGSQILSDIASEVTEKIKKIKDFSSIKMMDEQEAMDKGLLVMIGKEMDDDYINMVKGLSLREDIDKDIKIVYTPLNGTGNKPVRRVLHEKGFTNVQVVPEQEKPDPDFTTVGYPNPEDLKAFNYALELGKELKADLLIATDPDCDRVACVVKDNKDAYIPLNGNKIGALLIHYILEARKEKDDIPENGVIVKSIVTGDLGKAIASEYGVETLDVLTGFKNICGKANEFDRTKEHDFIFGYEESIGYVYEDKVRDKDGVMSSMLLAEAAAYYKSQGKTLIDVLDALYQKHGYYYEELFSIVLEGIEGKERIKRMMKSYRADYPKTIKDAKLVRYIDFEEQKALDILNDTSEIIEIPPTNGLKFVFDDESWYAIRPSGTEPKIKIYIYSKGKTMGAAKQKVADIKSHVTNLLDNID